MPDENGFWTPEERENMLRWLNDKTTPTQCTFCKQQKWSLGGVGVHLLAYRGGDVFVGGSMIPATVVFCTNCGHMEFFSPVLMGIMPGDGPKTGAQNEALPTPEVADAT